jgi:hypothetical protein
MADRLIVISPDPRLLVETTETWLQVVDSSTDRTMLEVSRLGRGQVWP